MASDRRAEQAAVCLDQDCDGRFHSCPDCGGEGFTEDDFDGSGAEEMVPCSTCAGRGGWACPSPA